MAKQSLSNCFYRKFWLDHATYDSCITPEIGKKMSGKDTREGIIKFILIMARIFIIMVLVLFWLQLFSQSTYFTFNNLKIKYSLMHRGLAIHNDSLLSSKYIIKVNLSESDKAQIKRLKKRDWLNLLQNPKTDWAANLVLYCIYEIDAIQYEINIKNRRDWLLVMKDEDIKFWKIKLK